MRVILSTQWVFPFHGYGGIEKYPFYLGKYLVKEGINVEIVTALDRGKKRVEIYNGIKYVFIPPMVYRRKLGGPWCYLYRVNVARYLRKEKFDVLHGYSSTPQIYLHFKNRAPTIVQPFGMEIFTAPLVTERRGFEKMYIKILAQNPWRYCITHADRVASEGDFQVDQIIKLFRIDKEKIFNLPIGVDIPFIRGRLETREISRKDLGLRDDDFVLISVNRFLPQKGINYLVDAFTRLKQKLDNTKLILIGGVRGVGEEKVFQKITDQINGYKLANSVFILKNVPEHLLYDYYGMSDVYVSPTLDNDFIMSIQEAMVAGLPIVSTDQEFLVKEGINGYIVPKRDPLSISNAVLKLYDKGEYKTMGKISQEIIKQYDWEKIAKIAIREYEKLIEKC